MTEAFPGGRREENVIFERSAAFDKAEFAFPGYLVYTEGADKKDVRTSAINDAG